MAKYNKKVEVEEVITKIENNAEKVAAPVEKAAVIETVKEEVKVTPVAVEKPVVRTKTVVIETDCGLKTVEVEY